MNFTSGLFISFLITLLVLFYGVPAKWRRPLLLIASYVFYATWSIPFIGIILATTSLDYGMSRIIARNTHHPKTQKAALVFGISLNLIILAFFKYTNFLLNTSWSLAAYCHHTLSVPHALNIILPLGISFYTFEAISYLVDVYRGNPPAANWLDYNFYIMYFPHLISGPIIRFGEMVHQYTPKLSLPDADRVARGLELIVLGFLFKVILANPAAQLVDPVFANPGQAQSIGCWVAVLAFTVQIYFDFMGYTHIARGVSLLFNIELPINFNHPYSATTISDFWTRWHITLSRWIRDYLYIPLGGSRQGNVRTAFNLILTMLLAGAWHGAGWPYILWGLYHGVLLALYHFWTGIKRALSLPERLFWGDRALCQATTFSLVMLGWILFRARHIKDAWVILSKMFHSHTLQSDWAKMMTDTNYTALVAIAYLLVVCLSGPLWTRLYVRCFQPLPYWGKVAVTGAVLIAVWIMNTDEVKPFIYFQF